MGISRNEDDKARLVKMMWKGGSLEPSDRDVAAEVARMPGASRRSKLQILGGKACWLFWLVLIIRLFANNNIGTAGGLIAISICVGFLILLASGAGVRYRLRRKIRRLDRTSGP